MVETIGFIVSVVALLYIFIKNSPSTEREKEAHRRKMPTAPAILPKGYQNKKYIREESKTHPVAPRYETQAFQTSLEQNHPQKGAGFKKPQGRTPLTLSATHYFPLEVDKETQPSRAENALRRLSSKRDLLIYQEIIDKPKSLRDIR